jgi:hypothetical protein
MTDSSFNPYAPPAALNAAPAGTSSSLNPWKAIAVRWELLRVPYNMLVGLVGVLGVVINGQLPWELVVAGALFYGLAANTFYLLGPIMEMYLNWLADFGENRRLPSFLVELMRSALVTWILFVPGTMISVVLTFSSALTVVAPAM